MPDITEVVHRVWLQILEIQGHRSGAKLRAHYRQADNTVHLLPKIFVNEVRRRDLRSVITNLVPDLLTVIEEGSELDADGAVDEAIVDGIKHRRLSVLPMFCSKRLSCQPQTPSGLLYLAGGCGILSCTSSQVS